MSRVGGWSHRVRAARRVGCSLWPRQFFVTAAATAALARAASAAAAALTLSLPAATAALAACAATGRHRGGEAKLPFPRRPAKQ